MGFFVILRNYFLRILCYSITKLYTAFTHSTKVEDTLYIIHPTHYLHPTGTVLHTGSRLTEERVTEA